MSEALLEDACNEGVARCGLNPDKAAVPQKPVSRRKPCILVVDQDTAASKVLTFRLKVAGFCCSSAKDGYEALAVLKAAKFDCVLADLRTSHLTGPNFLSSLRRRYGSLALVLLARPTEACAALKEMKEGADDCLIKPLNAKDVLKNLRRVLERKLAGSREHSSVVPSLVLPEYPSETLSPKADDPDEGTLLALGAALDLRDGQTTGHSRRVCMYSLEIAQRLGCSQVDLRVLRQGALLHDIGKLAIPDSVLWKPGALTPDEWTVMKAHVRIGYMLVRDIPSLGAAAELILTHHERYDGKGYPRGLAGKDIPLCARIFAVADTFDAMTTLRPYQQPVPLAAAADMIRRQKGKAFDPHVVDVFSQIPERTLSLINGSYAPNNAQVEADFWKRDEVSTFAMSAGTA